MKPRRCRANPAASPPIPAPIMMMRSLIHPKNFRLHRPLDPLPFGRACKLLTVQQRRCKLRLGPVTRGTSFSGPTQEEQGRAPCTGPRPSGSDAWAGNAAIARSIVGSPSRADLASFTSSSRPRGRARTRRARSAPITTRSGNPAAVTEKNNNRTHQGEDDALDRAGSCGGGGGMRLPPRKGRRCG